MEGDSSLLGNVKANQGVFMYNGAATTLGEIALEGGGVSAPDVRARALTCLGSLICGVSESQAAVNAATVTSNGQRVPLLLVCWEPMGLGCVHFCSKRH